MPKCILHVGMHKTGSTSIQNSLKELDDDKFYYARLIDRPNHSVTVNTIFSKPNDPRLSKRWFATVEDAEKQAKEGRRDLNASVEAANGRALVLSGEGMLSMPAASISKLKKYLNRHGYENIEVIAYIRPPIGYISSAVQQKIKAGNNSTLMTSKSVPNYQARFSNYDEVFGADNVHLYKFDPNSFTNRDVVADFCSKTGIPMSSITPIRLNESISRLAAQLRFQYTAYAEAEGLRRLSGGIAATLCGRLLALDTTRFRLAPSVIRPVVDSVRSDVEWMEKRLGQSLQEVFSDEPTDVRSEEDLLQPIPGINEKLRAILAEDGEPVPEAVADNTWKLLYLIAQSAREKIQKEAERHQDGESIRAQRRAARRVQRGAVEAGRKAGRRSEGRAGPGTGRQAQRQGGRPGGDIPQPGSGAGMRQGRAFGPQERGSMRPQRPARLAGVQDNAYSPIDAAPAAAMMPPPARAFAASRPSPTAQRPQQPPAMSPRDQQLMRSFRAMAQKGAGEGRNFPVTPLTMGPQPLLNKDKKLIVLWSPKSACTTMYVWFSHVSGFAEDVKNYAAWPHRHRREQYMKSELYAESAASGMNDAKALRIIRDPYSRAVSIYRHALQTRFADQDMDAFSSGRFSADKGFSFQTFLDLLEQLDMRRVDIHIRPQFHPYEKSRKADRVINISKSDLFTEVNAFEAETGMPKTNFEDFNWLHMLESKRKAKQEPMEGDALDQIAFSLHQVTKLGQFPSYNQLLTPAARERIERIYKVDFDAYRDYL